ncbi:MAG: Ppx/GppA family phosphatase [Solirubrobacteraceae bacterium]|nr:Ppx/GppA family phosphatase [Solirubrobacteraceae bacterium]
MRIAVVDIGTNSTRLLLADVAADGSITELARRSEVTRLGVGVDSSGVLADEAMKRVFVALDDYSAMIEELGGADKRRAVLTSATRDAANGPEFTRQVAERYQLDARAIAGEQEAQLSFLGATSGRDPGDGEQIVVVDIGGGSTELIIGHGRTVGFHVSTQLGVVRQSERHIAHDPPTADELQQLGSEVDEVLTAAVPQDERAQVTTIIAVAGTATSMAAIDLELEPYDAEAVHGYRVSLERCREIATRMASMPEAERRQVAGLHPDRAPTILAGTQILVRVIEAFGLDEVEVSEHDILYGVALDAAFNS